MKSMTLFLSVLLVASLGWCQEVKLAVVKTDEFREILREKVLADPMHKETKEKLDKVQELVRVLEAQVRPVGTTGPVDQPKMQELTQLHRQQNELSRALELPQKKLLLTVIKEIAKDKYVAVIDSDYGDYLLYKNAELVDITFDVKERLITKDP